MIVIGYYGLEVSCNFIHTDCQDGTVLVLALKLCHNTDSVDLRIYISLIKILEIIADSSSIHVGYDVVMSCQTPEGTYIVILATFTNR